MWFDDLTVGDVTPLGDHHFSAEAIVRFARDFDPQPFHLSEAAGKASIFGGLAASGWHTASAWAARLASHEATERSAAGDRPASPHVFAPDVTDLKWLKPVLAGDTLTYRMTVLAKARLPSTRGWGVATMLGEGVNQRRELAFQLTFRRYLALKE